ncbi:MAG: 2-oxo acid dehydrogenase subunit E2 [Clostridia bacterium]|nr:2-oxo acid dehydrogenase subunit E2 [Clostridia bacterium]
MSIRPTSVSTFGIQRKIVSNMTTEGWRSIPHCSYVYEPDLTQFIEKYKAFDAELQKEGKHVTLNTVIVKAICEALKSAPQMNAHCEFDRHLVRGTVTTYDQIDISMPWILPGDQMMTITMKDMGNRTLGDMTEYTAEMAKKIEKTNFDEAMYGVSINDTIEKLKKGDIVKVVRRLYGSFASKKHRIKLLTGEAKKAYKAIPDSEKITPADLKQGTITISNIGSISRGHTGNVDMLIVIPPQVCAICINAMQKKPFVVTNAEGKDEISIKTTIPLTICFDHRVLDFGEVKPFLDAMQRIIDNPECIFKY